MCIKKLIGETSEYEKKEMLEIKKPKSWLKSVSAFANGIGGTLIFGISDSDTIIGLSDAKRDAEIISEQIKTKLDPIPEVNLRFHATEDGKELIILQVAQGKETPYYYIGDGNRQTFIRIGNESVPADRSSMKRLVLKDSEVLSIAFYHYINFKTCLSQKYVRYINNEQVLILKIPTMPLGVSSMNMVNSRMQEPYLPMKVRLNILEYFVPAGTD